MYATNYSVGFEDYELKCAMSQLERLETLKKRVERAPNKAYAILNSPATRVSLEEVGVDHRQLALESISAGVVAAIAAAIAAIVMVIWKIIKMIRGGGGNNNTPNVPEKLTTSTPRTLANICMNASEETNKTMLENAAKVDNAIKADINKSNVASSMKKVREWLDKSEANTKQILKHGEYIHNYVKIAKERTKYLAKCKLEIDTLSKYLNTINVFLTNLTKELVIADNKVTDEIAESANDFIRKMRVDYPDFASLAMDSAPIYVNYGPKVALTVGDIEKLMLGEGLTSDLDRAITSDKHEAYTFSIYTVQKPMELMADHLEEIYQMKADDVSKLAPLKTELARNIGVIGAYLHGIKAVRTDILHAQMCKIVVRQSLLAHAQKGAYDATETIATYTQLKADAEEGMSHDLDAARAVDKQISRLRF